MPYSRAAQPQPTHKPDPRFKAMGVPCSYKLPGSLEHAYPTLHNCGPARGAKPHPDLAARAKGA